MSTNPGITNRDRWVAERNRRNIRSIKESNKDILNQAYASNAHLAQLNKQMAESNAINRQNLELQLKAEKQKEAQRYYKAVSFYISEQIAILSKMEDVLSLSYILNYYYKEIESNIQETNENIDEISEKYFNRESLDKLKALKAKADEKQVAFYDSILAKIDELTIDFQLLEAKKALIINPQETLPNTGIKRNIFRIAGIIILSIITFFWLFAIASSLLFSPAGKSDLAYMAIPMLFFAIPLVFLVLSERNWRKNYLPLLNAEKQRKVDYEFNKEKLEQKYRTEIAMHEETVAKHPFHKALADIDANFPSLWPTLEELKELEANFEKKWNS